MENFSVAHDQPKIIVMGSQVGYVIDNVKRFISKTQPCLQYDNCISAFITFFKALHLLDLKYPVGTQQFFSFIEVILGVANKPTKGQIHEKLIEFDLIN